MHQMASAVMVYLARQRSVMVKDPRSFNGTERCVHSLSNPHQQRNYPNEQADPPSGGPSIKEAMCRST